jgi:hypothetical protein
LQESLGMPMIYNLVTAAQEWLAARVAAGPGGAGEGHGGGGGGSVIGQCSSPYPCKDREGA